MVKGNFIHWWELHDSCAIRLDDKFIKCLKESRANAKLSQQKLANKIGLTRSGFQKIEYRIRNVKIATLKKWLKALKINYLDVEKNIRNVSCRKGIIKINFPIAESSSHGQIIAHGIFDGSKERHACLRYKPFQDNPLPFALDLFSHYYFSFSNYSG